MAPSLTKQLLCVGNCFEGTIYPKHLSLEFLVGHVLVGVNPFNGCTVVTPLPQITKLPKKITK
jgi:hypothetical protein